MTFEKALSTIEKIKKLEVKLKGIQEVVDEIKERKNNGRETAVIQMTGNKFVTFDIDLVLYCLLTQEYRIIEEKESLMSQFDSDEMKGE